MSPETISHEEGVLCPKCLLSNSPAAAFCADCGAPIGMVSAIDPIQQIQAEGFAYRSAVEGPPKLIILIGMWLIFGPVVLAAPFLRFGAFALNPVSTSLFTLFAIGSGIILFRVSRNYFVKTHPKSP